MKLAWLALLLIALLLGSGSVALALQVYHAPNAPIVDPVLVVLFVLSQVLLIMTSVTIGQDAEAEARDHEARSWGWES